MSDEVQVAEEPRPIQRLRRMKISANKFMDRIADHPKHEKVLVWTKRLQELVAGISVAEHEAAAAEVKKEQKKGGVNIKVPVHHFAVKSNEPEAVAE